MQLIFFRLTERPPLPPFYLDAIDQPIQTVAAEHREHALAGSMPSAAVAGKIGALIELHGGPASGKSAIMQHLLLAILSPTTLPDGTPAYGQEAPAVVIDVDRRLDPIRLHQTLVTHVVQCVLAAQGLDGHDAQIIAELERDPGVHDVVHTAMNRVSVYRIDHHQQLLAVLRTLARRIESEPPSPTWSPPRYLIIDSLSMLLWSLKSATGPVPQEYDDLSRTILAQLTRIRHRGVGVIVSTWEVFARRHLASVLRSQPGRSRGSTATSGLSADAVAQLVRQVDAHDPVAIAHALHIKAVDTLGATIGKSVTFRFVLTRLDTAEETGAEDERANDARANALLTTFVQCQLVHPRVLPPLLVAVNAQGVQDVANPT
ncbi:hypothetical protein GGF31_002945 [Allomyces arbusculus]|nr:hypothetical protein GGF31_002945 [Allomyces arbusculus]